MNKEKELRKVEIANRVRDARIAAGLTQQQVASILGITYQAVSNYELGKSSIEADLLYKLCTIYNADPAKILSPGISFRGGENVNNEKTVTVKVHLDTSDADTAIAHLTERLSKLTEMLSEAQSLAGDLTSMLNVLRAKNDPEYAASLLVSVDEVHIVP